MLQLNKELIFGSANLKAKIMQYSSKYFTRSKSSLP